MKKYIANIITGCRMICGILLLFFSPFSIQFYIVYLSGGFTDMIDGTIARKTYSTSAFGAKLDTAADFVFVAACVIKVFPMLNIPVWLWAWIIIIAVIKCISLITGFIIRKRLMVEHTIMNKITGFILFLLPLTLEYIELKYSAVVVCLVATIAAIQEGYYIRTGKDVDAIIGTADCLEKR